jgi:hypothetical protein
MVVGGKKIFLLFGGSSVCFPRMVVLGVPVCLSICFVLSVTVSCVDVGTFEVVA